MREVQEANARGEDKHPTRINITDAFVDLIQPLPPTKHAPELGPHNFVFSINTAGANSTLYSCPDREAMAAWVSFVQIWCTQVTFRWARANRVLLLAVFYVSLFCSTCVHPQLGHVHPTCWLGVEQAHGGVHRSSVSGTSDACLQSHA